MNLRECLAQVYEQYGELTPRLVVDIASGSVPDAPPEWVSTLQPRFEWDDAVAAEQHRIDQARNLIRSVRVTYRRENGDTSSVRWFHPVPTNTGPNQYVYEPADVIAENPLKRKIVLRQMEREWRTLKARYDAFEEFEAMILADLGKSA